jgi:hypothetical protein
MVVETTDLAYMPATIDSHTRRDDGMTLHTIDDDPKSDIETYDDDRPAHRAGNPPADS